MKKMTREELVDYMVGYELDTMSMDDLVCNFEDAIKFGTRGYSDYSNKELEEECLSVMDEEVRIIKVKEFKNAKEIAKYVYEELDKTELIKLMNDTRVFNNDVGNYTIEILLKKNNR